MQRNCIWSTPTHDGNLAVVGLLFKQGEPSPAVQAILDAAPAAGESVSDGITLNAGEFAPDELSHYRYDGSKTTPPCDEPVDWYVMREPKTISPEQVEKLLALSGGPTNRPIQPIGQPRDHSQSRALGNTPKNTSITVGARRVQRSHKLQREGSLKINSAPVWQREYLPPGLAAEARNGSRCRTPIQPSSPAHSATPAGTSRGVCWMTGSA